MIVRSSLLSSVFCLVVFCLRRILARLRVAPAYIPIQDFQPLSLSDSHRHPLLVAVTERAGGVAFRVRYLLEHERARVMVVTERARD